MTYEGFKYIQLKQNSQQKCEHLFMLELLVTYLNLLGMRNGGRKGNQNHPSYYIFTHVNFTIKGENFKLHRTYQWICTDSQAEKNTCSRWWANIWGKQMCWFQFSVTCKICTSFNIGGVIGFLLFYSFFLYFFYLKHIRLKCISRAQIVWTPFNSKNKMLYTFEVEPNNPPREAESSESTPNHGVPALILMQFPFNISTG